MINHIKKSPLRGRLNGFFIKLFNWQILDFFIYKLRKNSRLPNVAVNTITGSKLIFVHIPKNGGKSVSKALFPTIDNEILFPHKSIFYFKNHVKQEQKIISFCIVRNPWDRFISAFHYSKMIRSNQSNMDQLTQQFLMKFDNINDFLMENKKHNFIYRFRLPIFIPQYKYILNSFGQVNVDYILRFEKLESDFNDFCSKYKLNTTLPHINKSQHDHYSNYFNDETKKIVGDIYKKDINLFNYSF